MTFTIIEHLCMSILCSSLSLVHQRDYKKIGSILIDIGTYKLGTITAFETVITSTPTFEIKQSAYYGKSCKEGLF